MTDLPKLTATQLTILRLGAEPDATYARVGQRMHMSPDSIKTHMQAICALLGVRGRLPATLTAVRLGLLHLPGIAATGAPPAPEPEPAPEPPAPVRLRRHPGVPQLQPGQASADDLKVRHLAEALRIPPAVLAQQLRRAGAALIPARGGRG